MTNFYKCILIFLGMTVLAACSPDTGILEQPGEINREGDQLGDGTTNGTTQEYLYLTRNMGTIKLIDLVSGKVEASYTLIDGYEFGHISDFGNGYFAGLAARVSPNTINHRNRDVEDSLVDNHDYNERLIIFDSNLNITKTFYLIDSPIAIQFPFFFDLLTFENGELVIYFKNFPNSYASYIYIKSYNFHTEDINKLGYTDIFIMEFLQTNMYTLNFFGFINESGEIGDPGTLFLANLNIPDGKLNYNRIGGFAPRLNGFGVANGRGFIAEELENFLIEDLHYIYNGVLLFDPETLEHRIIGLPRGDSSYARLTPNGNYIVTLNVEYDVFCPIRGLSLNAINYFRKYDLTGRLLFNTEIIPIPLLVDFEQLRVSLNPRIVPIDNETFAVLLYNEMHFGFYGIHQIIRILSEGN